MKNKTVLIAIGAVVGFFIGYLIFGKILGSHVSISSLFDFSGGFGKLGRSVAGVKDIQIKVFISAGVGAVLAYIYSIKKKK